MISFEKKFKEISGSVREFGRDFDIRESVLERLCEDYKYFLDVPLLTARKIANGLGKKFSWIVYDVESEIVKDMYDTIRKNWDKDFQQEAAKYRPVDQYLPYLFSRCMEYKDCLTNKDIMRSLAIAVHIDARQREENPKPDPVQYYFSGILNNESIVRNEFKKVKGNPERLMKWVEIISSEAEYNLNIKDLAKSIFYFFNTIV